MSTEELKNVLSGIATAHWLINFKKFCEITGFVGDYANVKWHQWRELNDNLGEFDAETLQKLIEAKK